MSSECGLCTQTIFHWHQHFPLRQWKTKLQGIKDKLNYKDMHNDWETVTNTCAFVNLLYTVINSELVSYTIGYSRCKFLTWQGGGGEVKEGKIWGNRMIIKRQWWGLEGWGVIIQGDWQDECNYLREAIIQEGEVNWGAAVIQEIWYLCFKEFVRQL